jgi:uncharacterized protein
VKYLIVIVVVLAVIWFVRNNRRPPGDTRRDKPAAPPPAGEPQDMIRCPVCSVHLPRLDALPGPDGKLYCCAEHRARAGS